MNTPSKSALTSPKAVRFSTAIGKNKPETLVTGRSECPFCHPESLTDIIETDGDIIFLKNKYNVLTDAEQFVLVESSRCDDGIEQYSPEKLHRLFRLALRHFHRMLNNPDYKSVIFFKNHGPLSGGTIRHPHMQIIGFYDIEPETLYEAENFLPADNPIVTKDGLQLTASAFPRLGFGEFTITSDTYPLSEQTVDTLADLIQHVVRLLLNIDWRENPSYNLFFYYLKKSNQLAVRIMPRHPTSPLFVGYDLRIVPDNIAALSEKLKKSILENS
ncbi:MAG: DUF4931 domain-containing protein [Selenomonadaceae bacterium]|nr:DUF4931 domain-containing protein [Selenomonadaceae bacterium]